MDEPSLYLCRTPRPVRAEGLGLLLILYQSCTAVRTGIREVGEHDIRTPLTEFHSCNLRNDLAAFLYIDIISYMDIMYPHLLFIVKRGPLDYSAAELYRFQICHRSNGTCPSDLIVDAQKLCKCLFRLEFVGYSPPRELGRISQFFLIWKFVDLYHYSVGRKRQILSFNVPISDEILDLVDGSTYTPLVRHRKPPTFCGLESRIMCLERKIFAQHMVKGTFKSSVSHHAAVNELERPGSGISWIGERLFLVSEPFLIKPVESCPRHVDLSADLKLFRPVTRTGKGLRNIGYMSYIFRNIVTYGSVSSGQCSEKPAVSICKADCRTVKLEFAAVCE